jgi:hypothetical protein
MTVGLTLLKLHHGYHDDALEFQVDQTCCRSDLYLCGPRILLQQA